MNFIINQRAVSLGKFILKTNQTVRQVAGIYGISKSTVHFDVSTRLKKIDYNLYIKVKKILEKNFKEKHLRGGEATRKKYLKINK